ncbi:MAG: hypothetical protein ACWA44_14895 [Thiotrichales bacterium]
MKQFLILLIVASLFGAIAYFGPRLVDQQSAAVEAEVEVPDECDFAPGSCQIMVQGHQVTIAVADRITPLKPAEVTVTASDLIPVRVDFEMIGMDMGDNHFSFTRSGENSWKAEVILPVCSMGRNDWLAHFDFRQAESADHSIRINYPFELTRTAPD